MKTRMLTLTAIAFVLLSSSMIGFAAAPQSGESYIHPLTTTTGYTYFNESGLPSGTSWSVVYNSLNESSPTSSIKFTETVNIEYNYKVNEAYNGITQYAPSPQTGTAKAISSVSISFTGSTFTANLTTDKNPTDVNVKNWYYSDPSGPAPSQHYYQVYGFVNGVNETTMSISSNGVVYVGYFIYGSSGTDSIYFLYHVNGTSLNFDSSTLTITVNPPVSISISSSKNPIDYGQSVTFNSNVTGGTPPYSYQWEMNGQNVTGATSSTWTTSTLPVGNDSIQLWVFDSVGDPSPDHPNSSIPNVVVGINPGGETTIYSGDSFGFTITQIGGLMMQGTDYSYYTYQWSVNGNLIQGATNWTYSTFENMPGTYHFVVKIVSNSTQSGVYQGTWYGGATVNVTDNLAPNSVKFVESGLPNGSYWSAAFIVLSKNTSYPYGTMFYATDGLISKVNGNGIPAIVINPPNGTWTWYVRTYVWDNATHNFEMNASTLQYISSSYVANVSQGTVTMPGNSANGSTIIHIGFSLAGDPPTNSTNPAMNIAPLNAIREFSTMKELAIQYKTLPISAKGPTVAPLVTKTTSSPVSRPAFSIISFIFVSLVAIVVIISALMVQRSSRKKQRNEEVDR